MSQRCLIVMMMIGATILAGCQVDTTPNDVANFSTNRTATQEQAAYDGTYSLFADDSDKSTGPVLLTSHLKRGEEVGFEIDAHQIPFAVAGKDRLQLSPGRYRWQMTPAAGQVDWDRTNVVVIEVVVATAVVVLAVVTTIIATKGKL